MLIEEGVAASSSRRHALLLLRRIGLSPHPCLHHFYFAKILIISRCKYTRDEFENLIVLCPSCHTIVDKNPQTFTVDVLKKWKKDHENSIKNLMSSPVFHDREEARNALFPLLEENKAIFDMYGPYSENATNKQMDAEVMWYRLSLQNIIPNNRKIESILGNNQHLMTDKERRVFNLFKLHRDGFEYNKISGDVNPAVPLFPKDLNNMFL